VTPHRTLAVVSGLALAAAHPEPSIWFFGWVGIVPLLYAVRGKTPRRAFGLGWLAGVAHFAALLYWIAPTISNYTQITQWQAVGVLVVLSLVLGALMGGFVSVLEWLASAGISRVVAAPALWVVYEWMRYFVPAPCPWSLLGYSQYTVTPAIQIADLGGIYLVSAVLAFVNAALAELLRVGVRARPRLLIATLAVPLLTLVYGAARISTMDRFEGRTIQIGVAQASVAQQFKWDRAYENSTVATYSRLTREAAAAGAQLVVWPEAAVPFYVPQDLRSRELERLSASTGVEMFVGTPGAEQTDEGIVHYNRAWHVVPERGLDRSYDKIQLVPFGEYVPFGFLLSWLDRAVVVIGDFGRGEEYTVFEGPLADNGQRSRFSGLICYEGIFPGLTREFVAVGAELLLNISNDAWYGYSSAPYQHLAMASVRAVENRVPLVRATNTGVSAVVDRVGRIRAATPLFEEAWFVEPVEVGYAGSVYTEFGDWFLYSALGFFVFLVAVRIRNGDVLTGGCSDGILSAQWKPLKRKTD
jgi:apolipoprotein N-acyltransferase